MQVHLMPVDLMPVDPMPVDPTQCDLTHCDREPIHIPGAIQPHGVLLVVDEPRGTVVQVSENVEARLGVAVNAVLGRPLADLLEPASAQDVLAALSHERWDETNPLLLRAGG